MLVTAFKALALSAAVTGFVAAVAVHFIEIPYSHRPAVCYSSLPCRSRNQRSCKSFTSVVCARPACRGRLRCMLVCRFSIAALRRGSLSSGHPAPADVHIVATQSTCDKSCPCSAGGLTCRTGFLQQAVGCYCLCWQQTVGSRSGTQHISLELLSGSLQLHQHTTIGPQKLLVTILGCCVHAFW